MSPAMNNTRHLRCHVWLLTSLIALVPVGGALSHHGNNAALLYYQALLLHPAPSETPSRTVLQEIARGAPVDSAVRSYLDAARATVETAMTATELRHCDWGVMSPAWGTMPPDFTNLTGQLRQLALLLDVDARASATSGEWRVAIKECLGIRSLSFHLVDDGVALWYPMSLEFNTVALNCIQGVLGDLTSEDDELVWLQSQLAVQGAPPLPSRAVAIALDAALHFLSAHPEFVETWKDSVAAHATGASGNHEFLALTNEDVLNIAKQSYEKVMASANRLLAGNLPYHQKRTGLKHLVDILEDEGRDGHPVSMLVSYMPNVSDLYDAYIVRLAHFNAVSAAIEVYLVEVETGELPAILPIGLARDPYTDLPFEYEHVKDGFVLRCRAEDLAMGAVQEFSFRINRK